MTVTSRPRYAAVAASLASSSQMSAGYNAALRMTSNGTVIRGQ
jgi:hypothetical protein